MIYEVYNNNGTKDIRPIAGSIPGQGNPVGTILPYWGSNIPDKYLLCDGSTFDADEYPALYMHLGSNVLPDLRECVLVGVGENDTQTIDTHDVYTLGEFKDDQFQGHEHSYQQEASGSTSSYNIRVAQIASVTGRTCSITTDGTNGTPRIGSTTHGKQTGVNYIIKATASMDTDDAQSVFQNIKNYIEGDVLWEIDPSSISTQPAQSYTLDTGKSFADYKYIDVYVTQAPVVTLDLDDPKGVKYNNGVDVYTSHFFTTYPTAANGSRNFKVLSDTTFQVYDCYIGSSTYNHNAIIYKVVGKNHK